MSEIGVILSGVGGVGRNVTRLLSARPGYEVVAACSRNPNLVGQDVGVLAGVEPLGVQVVASREEALAKPADLLLVATTSFLREVADDVRAGAERGLDVITTAEEAFYPWSIDEGLANELDELARQRGVTLLGVGLNPGFIFDTLVLTVSAIAWDVRSIRIRRVVDISRFSATIQRRMGLGFSPAEFEERVSAGAITGHIGFRQGFALVAKCLGRSLERITESFESMVAEDGSVNEHLKVEPGKTGGLVQRVTGFVAGDPWIAAEFTAYGGQAGYTAEDSISIEGLNSINLVINPGCQPQLGTAAMIANCIPRVVEARPGFLTVADLQLPYARPTDGELLRRTD